MFICYVMSVSIGPSPPGGVPKVQYQLSLLSAATVWQCAVRDGRECRAGQTSRQADGRFVSVSSHASRLLYCVLVTKVIAVCTTSDTVWCSVFGSLGVAASNLLLLLLPACRWFLDSLSARNSLTSTHLHC